MAYLAYNTLDDLLSFRAYAHLKTAAKSSSNWINFYLDEKKEEVAMLTDSLLVIEALRENPEFDSSLIKSSLQKRAEKVSKDCEDYILTNPDMTSEDLQKDPVFQNLAVQYYGSRGYTSIQDVENARILIHPKSEFNNVDLNSFEFTLPELWEIMEASLVNDDVYGFYRWIEPTGEINNKFIYVKALSVVPADGVKMNIAASDYLEDYRALQISDSFEEKFKSFTEYAGYDDLFLISSEGNVIYSVKRKFDLGTNLIYGEYNQSSLAKLFLNVKEDGIVKISKYDYYDPSSDISLFIMAPVYSKEEFLGMVAIKINGDQINQMTLDRTGLGETGEIYLVDQNKFLLTPSRFMKNNILYQRVDTLNVDNCLEDIKIYYNESSDVVIPHEEFESISFRNYRGEYVLGVHNHIHETGWCLLVEVEEEEILGVPHEELFSYIIILSFVLGLVILFVSFLVGERIDRRCKK